MKKTIVVFKTHFDIGFTDFAGTVLEKYRNTYIPAALELTLKVNKEKP